MKWTFLRVEEQSQITHERIRTMSPSALHSRERLLASNISHNVMRRPISTWTHQTLRARGTVRLIVVKKQRGRCFLQE